MDARCLSIDAQSFAAQRLRHASRVPLQEPPTVSSLCRSRLAAILLCALALLTAPNGFGQASGTPVYSKVDSNPTFVYSQFDPAKPLRLIAYGDMRFANPSLTQAMNPKVRSWLAAKVGEERPQALLLTGDMPYVGESMEDWEEFQKETSSWRTAGFPIFPTPGNHEVYFNQKKGIANYFSNFPGIEGHRYYSALLGQVEVISLDMNLPADPRSDQARWFAAQLDHLPASVEFLLILYHLPWVADTQSQFIADLPSAGTLIFRNLLEARLSRINAKVVVFNGHIHNYERFERMGVEYIVTGGGGAEPYRILFRGRHDLYRDKAFPVYNYLTIEVRDHQLHGVMWKVADPDAPNLTVEAKDSFIIQAKPAGKP
jgi:hypothetical protein